MARNVKFYAIDTLGNRMLSPLSFAVYLDAEVVLRLRVSMSANPAAFASCGTLVEKNMSIGRREFIRACAAAAAALGLSSGGRQAHASARPGSPPKRAPRDAVDQASLQLVAPKPATAITAAVNAAVLGELPFSDRQDYADAARGLIAELPNGGYIPPIPGVPAPVWNLPGYSFLQEEVPPEANPSLWRQAQLNMFNGLFKVVDGIYQVRGADLSNMTIIEGKKGIIIIDPLVSCQTAQVGLELYRQQRGQRRVAAVIYTHSHTDHYAGVRGVVDEADVQSGKTEIIAPDRFLEKVLSENVLAGVAMSRRSLYSYGVLLPRSKYGQIDAGLGKGMSLGQISLIPPTDSIIKTGERRKIDGIEIIFQLTPDAEAPAEMMMYYPKFRTLNAAEVACALMHNVYTPRGAEVRDATKWSYFLNEAMRLFGDGTDVVIGQHNWPTWGHDAVMDFLKHQRDLYKYLHDQTLHLANQGLTMTEIAEELSRNRALPASLGQQWYDRGYYGTVSHNVKAIYQKYLGWYDCNPASLESLTPEEAGPRYVEFMGGAANVITMAQAAFDAGEYRWVAQVMNHVVFADPTNVAARNLAADALEQLGYQSESAIWRNHYLTGAFELRNGNSSPGGRGSANADTIRAMPIGSYFDYLGVRLNAPRAEGKHIVLNWSFMDTGETYTLNLENSALTYESGKLAAVADAGLTLARSTLDEINLDPHPEQAFLVAIQSGAIRVSGNVLKIAELFGLFDTFGTGFNIIEP